MESGTTQKPASNTSCCPQLDSFAVTVMTATCRIVSVELRSKPVHSLGSTSTISLTAHAVRESNRSALRKSLSMEFRVAPESQTVSTRAWLIHR